MGTRADFYVGRGKQAEWIGSIAWDGYPNGIEDNGKQTGGTKALTATTEEDFRQGVKEFGVCRNDFTDPAERGWPWPWDTSATTDYAYAYDDGKVYGSGYGRPWFEINLDQTNGGEPLDEDEDGNEIEVPTTPAPVFPDMRERQEVRFDEGSGLIVF